MPIQPSVWLSEFTANASTAGTQSQPMVVQLANGNFWIVWTAVGDVIAYGDNGNIVGQLFDPLGVPIGAAMQLNNYATIDDEQFPALAADVGSSNFFMAYSDISASTGLNDRIVLELLNSSGVVVNGLDIVLDPTADGTPPNLSDPDVAIASATSGAVIWQQSSSSTGDDIYLQRFDATTMALVGTAILIDSDSDNQGESSIIALSNGTYVVTYTDQFSASDIDLRFRIVQQDGTVGAEVTVAQSNNNETEPAITPLSTGGFVISWTDSANVYARIFSSDGVAVTSAIAVAVSGVDSQNQSSVAATNDGGFVVTWENDSSSQIFSQSFTGAGVAVGVRVAIDTGGSATGGPITLGLGDGRVLVTYDQGTDIRGQIIDPRDAPNALPVYTFPDDIVGTIRDDVFNFTDLPNDVHGWDGNDVMTDTQGAECNFFGDDGDDIIRLTYVQSEESAHGGAGNDTLEFIGFNLAPATVNLEAGTTVAGGTTMVTEQFENFTTALSNAFTVTGTSGYNVIITGGGNDIIYSGSGGDLVNTGAGNDIIVNSFGNAVLNGGDGVDTVDYSTLSSAGSLLYWSVGLGYHSGLNFSSPVSITFQNIENLFLYNANDFVRGTGAANRILGNGGDDNIRSLSGNDDLSGGDGNDVLDGGTGVDYMNGGAGNDIFFVDNLNDTVEDTTGIDEVRSTVNYILGGPIENLRLQGTAVVGTGNASNNNIFGGAAANVLSGLGGNDNLYGNSNNDTLNGDADDDTLFGGQGNDTLNGGTGNDALRGDDGSDIINGGAGNDTAFGSIGIDTIHGDAGDDILRGEAQNDFLYGDDGADQLQGGDGNDALYGGIGRDLFTGGLGGDGFYFDDGDYSGLTNATADRILDFVQGSDRIRLTATDAIAGGADNAFTFIGTAAFTGAAGQLRYSQAGGITLVQGDTDGDGTADIAVALTGLFTLVAGDFAL